MAFWTGWEQHENEIPEVCIKVTERFGIGIKIRFLDHSTGTDEEGLEEEESRQRRFSHGDRTGVWTAETHEQNINRVSDDNGRRKRLGWTIFIRSTAQPVISRQWCRCGQSAPPYRKTKVGSLWGTVSIKWCPNWPDKPRTVVSVC